MGIELDLVLYAVSAVALGIFSGASVALEVLSLSTGDRSADEEEADGYVDRLLEDPTMLDPARRELTFFFSDLQGFTTLAEKLGEEE